MRIAFALTMLATPLSALATLNPPQIISLMPQDSNLENENLIETLCPKSVTDQKGCREGKLQAKTWSLNVYEAPSAESKVTGRILITGVPGKGMTAQYAPSGKKAVSFPSDSGGTDWGYSSYFEFTVSEVKGDWTQLPKRPFDKPIWINIKRDWQIAGGLDLRPTPKSLETGVVYSAGKLGSIVFTKFSGTQVSFRKENASDMPCGDEPRPIQPVELKVSIEPVEDLFDSDGHLRVWPAYPRGC